MKKLLILFAAAICCSANAQQVAPFKAGDRVAFVGNSITDGGHYHSYIWLYYMTHFPGERLWMANCGIGGDTAGQILQRLDGDVFAKRPNIITLTFGMNDSGYFEYNGDNAEAFGNSKVAESRENFLQIEKRLKGATDVRKIMIGTSPYDQTSTFNDNIFKNKNDYMQKPPVPTAGRWWTSTRRCWRLIPASRPKTRHSPSSATTACIPITTDTCIWPTSS